MGMMVLIAILVESVFPLFETKQKNLMLPPLPDETGKKVDFPYSFPSEIIIVIKTRSPAQFF